MRIAVIALVLLALAVLAAGLIIMLEPFDAPLARLDVPDARGDSSGGESTIRKLPDAQADSRTDLPTRREEASRALLTGPVISGTVTNRLTGEPVRHLYHIQLWEGTRGSDSLRQIEIERFCPEGRGSFIIPIMGLPLREDARYNLVFESTDYVVHALENLAISREEGLTGLDVRLEPKGALEIVCRSFDKAGLRNLALTLTCASFSQAETFWRHQAAMPGIAIHRSDGWEVLVRKSTGALGMGGSVEPDGSCVSTWDLEPGLWSFTADIGNQRFRQDITIVSGGATRLELKRDDLAPSLVVAGSLRYSDGVPVAGAELIFKAVDIPEWRGGFTRDVDWRDQGQRQRTLKYVTDEDGRFESLDFLTGTWRLTGYLEDGSTPVLPDVVIPADPASPYPLDLVVHRSAVAGTLCDSATQLELGEDYTRWFLLVRNCATGEIVADHGNRFGSNFRVACVPPGRHQLEVRARGFVDHVSQPFVLAAGQELDLGEIGMSRQEKFGSLVLTLTDRSGLPFEHTVTIEVHKLLGIEKRTQLLPWGEKGCTWEWLGWHSYRFDRLPAELLNLKIILNGRTVQEIPVTIEAGKTLTRTLALEEPR